MIMSSKNDTGQRITAVLSLVAHLVAGCHPVYYGANEVVRGEDGYA
jgi:hypothetical protein